MVRVLSALCLYNVLWAERRGGWYSWKLFVGSQVTWCSRKRRRCTWLDKRLWKYSLVAQRAADDRHIFIPSSVWYQLPAFSARPSNQVLSQHDTIVAAAVYFFHHCCLCSSRFSRRCTWTDSGNGMQRPWWLSFGARNGSFSRPYKHHGQDILCENKGTLSLRFRFHGT